MFSKELRIVIADTSLPKLIKLEKSLNRLGHHRVLPVQAFEDLWALAHKPNDFSYILIANKSLALGTGVDWLEFCQKTSKINNTLLYEKYSKELFSIAPRSPKVFSTRCVDVPHEQLIKAFMMIIDSPSSRDEGEISYLGE